MSNDLNQCQFIGHLGRDPETRYTSSGSPVCSFSIACGWKSKDKEGTEWVNITAFGKLAEICEKYLAKGKQVFIQGRMTTDKYEKDGVTRYSTKIIADRMQMLGGGESKPGANDYQRQSRPPNTDCPQLDQGNGFADDGVDSEIPF